MARTSMDACTARFRQGTDRGYEPVRRRHGYGARVIRVTWLRGTVVNGEGPAEQPTGSLLERT